MIYYTSLLSSSSFVLAIAHYFQLVGSWYPDSFMKYCIRNLMPSASARLVAVTAPHRTNPHALPSRLYCTISVNLRICARRSFEQDLRTGPFFPLIVRRSRDLSSWGCVCSRMITKVHQCGPIPRGLHVRALRSWSYHIFGISSRTYFRCTVSLDFGHSNYKPRRVWRICQARRTNPMGTLS